MKYESIKNLNIDDLQDQLYKYKKEYFNLRFQKVLGDLSNFARIRKVRRSIAMILTAINNIRRKN